MRISFVRSSRQARLASQDKHAERGRLAQYNTYEARHFLSDLLRRVRQGEEIVIAHAGHPIAKLVPYAGGDPTRPGLIRAHVVVHDGAEEEER